MTMVRIRVDAGGAEAVSEPMPRTDAINRMREMYNLPTTKWSDNRQVYVWNHVNLGRQVWIVKLIPC